ncbi:MAG: hypothetical protein PHE50_06450 [Dehalococcoidales bacterium]|nr:hypothetical protein [Dehalococcoidales bacterium]
MKRKLIILLSVLVIALALIGTSAWLLAARSPSENAAAAMEIVVVPGPGSVLPRADGAFSQILMTNVKVAKTPSNLEYLQLSPSQIIKQGDQILVMTLTIQNMHEGYKIIGVSAAGFDAQGTNVARTLDDALHGMAWTQLDYQETGEITIHLNYAKDIKQIKIFGSNYQYPVP